MHTIYSQYPTRPYLRDGVDVYYNPENGDLFLVFLASRKRINLKCNEHLIRALELMDGEHDCDEIQRSVDRKFRSENSGGNIVGFVEYLFKCGVIVDKEWKRTIDMPEKYKNRLSKQLEFLLDICGSTEVVEQVQKRIQSAKLLIIGTGSVGGWICRELAMVGFTNLALVDCDSVASSDVSRHCFYNNKCHGEMKVNVLHEYLLGIAPEMKISVSTEALSIDSNLSNYKDYDMIINAADEPYIGYTSLKLSRFCVEHDIPLFVAGGFDAHLGCLGELIIPHRTPCSDCYNSFFQEALRDWKPIKHPVERRQKSFGGLASLSVFSASTAIMKIVRYFIDSSEGSLGRGELIFDDYSIDSFEVERDQNCLVCGVRNER